MLEYRGYDKLVEKLYNEEKFLDLWILETKRFEFIVNDPRNQILKPDLRVIVNNLAISLYNLEKFELLENIYQYSVNNKILLTIEVQAIFLKLSVKDKILVAKKAAELEVELRNLLLLLDNHLRYDNQPRVLLPIYPQTVDRTKELLEYVLNTINPDPFKYSNVIHFIRTQTNLNDESFDSLFGILPALRKVMAYYREENL